MCSTPSPAVQTNEPLYNVCLTAVCVLQAELPDLLEALDGVSSTLSPAVDTNHSVTLVYASLPCSAAG